MEIDVDRARVLGSVVVSGVLALLFMLIHVPPQYDLLRYIVAAVLGMDAVVKLLVISGVVDTSLWNVSSGLYSLALAVAIATFFKVFGDPTSYIFAALFVVDALAKFGVYRGIFPEFWRHVFSAIATLLLGLSILFGVRPAIFPLLGVIIGLFLIFDGIIKLEYANVL